MGDYVKKKREKPTTMDLFGREEAISISESVNKSPITYDLFIER